MTHRIAIIQGHPDRAGGHLCHALADAYAAGAEASGHAVRRIDVARLEFPLLRTKEAFERDAPPPDIQTAQETLRWADHLLIVYPLWLGGMPALLRGFFEQVFRPRFAFAHRPRGLWTKLLKGRSARILVTMGMPTLVYRFYYRAHGLKSLERSILRFCGIGPVRESLFGMVDVASDATRRRWLRRMESLGRRAR